MAQALASNPTVKLSLEQVALLEGRIVEASADALPDITWNTLAMRSRDPGLLNSPNFDEFPPEFRDALRPLPGNAFSTTADVRQTLFSFKLGKALEAARVARTAGDQDMQRARQLTALDAIRAYNQLLFSMEQLRVIRTNVQSKQTHVDYARNRRAAGVATELEVLRAEVDLENARAEALRAENEVSGARALLNTVMLRPTSTPVVPTDSLAVVPFAAEFDAAVKEALDGEARAAAAAHAGARAGSADRCHRRRREAERRVQRFVRVRRAAAAEPFRSGFLALVRGDQPEGAALRRQAHGRPRRAGACRSATP